MSIDLRAVLNQLKDSGVSIKTVGDFMSPTYEIPGHYMNNAATVPGSGKTGHEQVFIYANNGTQFPVLMGLFGNREINRKILSESCFRDDSLHRKDLSPVWVDKPVCQESHFQLDLLSLPALKVTPQDAGAFFTSGVVCARHHKTGAYTSSIHRLKVVDKSHVTLALRPGSGLFSCYQEALKQNKTLPISICIGIPPVYYLLTSLSTARFSSGICKLKEMSKVVGQAVRIAKNVTNSAYCYADSEIVIEGEMTTTTCNESNRKAEAYSMPEFLGYMGEAKENLPLVKITGIFHRENPIYQTFLGPGKEQSELLAIPTEISLKEVIRKEFDQFFDLMDVYCPSYGGGQLSVILSIRRKSHFIPFSELRDFIYEHHPLCKHVYVVDDDIDHLSSEDFLWAMTTRFQVSQDTYLRKVPGFIMDPSQYTGYMNSKDPESDLTLYDLTKPLKISNRFVRYQQIL